MLVAIYCRLSREDEDKQENKKAGKQNEKQDSESIQNQKSLLIKYALDREWDIYKIYSDDDYSGSDKNRPEYNKLLKDAENKCFDIVLVKNQSRFTRDMEMVEKYIHGLFMLWGIRFVAALDNTDTAIKGTKKARQISGLINEWYLEDLSDNIRAVFDNKRHNGEYIGSYPVYGYLLDKTQNKKFIVDEKAAKIVKWIFNMYLSGYGLQKIARELNTQGVPNPTKYKQELGIKFRNGYQKNNYGLWNTTTLCRMLKDQTYAGDLVQGRTKSISYKMKGTMPTPKDKWVIVPNTHEPIIEKDCFMLAQEMMEKKPRFCKQTESHVLAGKVFCADCKSILHKHSDGQKNGVARHYLRCKLYLTNHSLCSIHSVRLDYLENLVLTQIKEHLKNYYKPIEEKEINIEEDNHKIKENKALVIGLEQELSEIQFAIRNLYLDKTKGIIEETQFCELNQMYLKDKQTILQKIDALKNQPDYKQELAVKKRRLQAQIKEMENPKILTKELVTAFVDRIEVGEKRKKPEESKIEIYWNF